jgi:hypothetical protein
MRQEDESPAGAELCPVTFDRDPLLLPEDFDRIRFRLLLTPAERLKLNDAMRAELFRKRKLVRQFGGRPHPADPESWRD